MKQRLVCIELSVLTKSNRSLLYLMNQGCQIGQFGLQLGHIVVLRSVFCSFDSQSQNEQNTDLKKSQICPIWCQYSPIGDGI